MASLYLDTSAVLGVVIEQGSTPELSARIRSAWRLLTSRLSLVETARAFHRLRLDGVLGEAPRAGASGDMELITAKRRLKVAAVC